MGYMKLLPALYNPSLTLSPKWVSRLTAGVWSNNRIMKCKWNDDYTKIIIQRNTKYGGKYFLCNSAVTAQTNSPPTTESNSSEIKAKYNAGYQNKSYILLQYLHDAIDEVALPTLEELNLDDESLKIDTGGGNVIVINKHYVNNQIWYSAPGSGPDYFEFFSPVMWTSKRSGKTIFEKLSEDIEKLTGIKVKFDMSKKKDSPVM